MSLGLLSTLSQCGGAAGMWPKREGDIWWSASAGTSGGGHHPHGIPGPITEEQLQDWLCDTVGWAAVEISHEAFLAASAHTSQVKALVLAAFEAAARLNTRKCRFRQVDIDAALAKCISMALAAYSNLKVLVLQELNVYEEAVFPLVSGLRGSEHLVKLSLVTVDFSSAGWEATARALAQSESLRHLKIRGSLPRHALSSLCHALKAWPSLQVLDVGNNPLGDAGVTRLCDVLAHSSTIRILKIHGTGCEAQGALAVARLLRASKQLSCLHIDHNQLGPQGCSEVAKAVGGSPSLQQLWASHTGWDDLAVQHLCASLMACPSLSALDLGYNRVTMKGSHMLSAAALKVALVVVKLSGNCAIGTDGIKSWAQVVATPRRPLAQLSLSDCEASDPAAFALAGALRLAGDQGGLETLEVASNHMTHTGIGELVKAARSSPTLRVLDVSFNWLGPRAMAACLQAPLRHSQQEQPTAYRTQNKSPGVFGLLRAATSTRASPAGAAAGGGAAGGAAAGGASGAGLLGVAAPQCEIRSEVLQEFRDIEHVKFGDWQQLTVGVPPADSELPTPHPQAAASPTGDYNPFLATHSEEVQGRATAVQEGEQGPLEGRAVRPADGHSTSGANHLHPGYAIPARLARQSSQGRAASSESGSEALSNETHASSSRSSLGSMSGENGGGEGDNRQKQSQWGCAEGLPGGQGAGTPRHSKVGVSGPVLEQLQGLQDGTINAQLPVSFAAGEDPADSADLPSAAAVRGGPGLVGAKAPSVRLGADHSNPFLPVSDAQTDQRGQSVPGVAVALAPKPAPSASVKPASEPGHAGSRMGGQPSSAGVPSGAASQSLASSSSAGGGPSLLTEESVQQLHQQLGGVTTGELLLLDAARQQQHLQQLRQQLSGGAPPHSNALFAQPPALQHMQGAPQGPVGVVAAVLEPASSAQRPHSRSAHLQLGSGGMGQPAWQGAQHATPGGMPMMSQGAAPGHAAGPAAASSSSQAGPHMASGVSAHGGQAVAGASMQARQLPPSSSMQARPLPSVPMHGGRPVHGDLAAQVPQGDASHPSDNPFLPPTPPASAAAAAAAAAAEATAAAAAAALSGSAQARPAASTAAAPAATPPSAAKPANTATAAEPQPVLTKHAGLTTTAASAVATATAAAANGATPVLTTAVSAGRGGVSTGVTAHVRTAPQGPAMAPFAPTTPTMVAGHAKPPAAVSVTVEAPPFGVQAGSGGRSSHDGGNPFLNSPEKAPSPSNPFLSSGPAAEPPAAQQPQHPQQQQQQQQQAHAQHQVQDRVNGHSQAPVPLGHGNSSPTLAAVDLSRGGRASSVEADNPFASSPVASRQGATAAAAAGLWSHEAQHATSTPQQVVSNSKAQGSDNPFL